MQQNSTDNEVVHEQCNHELMIQWKIVYPDILTTRVNHLSHERLQEHCPSAMDFIMWHTLSRSDNNAEVLPSSAWSSWKDEGMDCACASGWGWRCAAYLWNTTKEHYALPLDRFLGNYSFSSHTWQRYSLLCCNHLRDITSLMLLLNYKNQNTKLVTIPALGWSTITLWWNSILNQFLQICRAPSSWRDSLISSDLQIKTTCRMYKLLSSMLFLQRNMD